jgi:PKD repeat protein
MRTRLALTLLWLTGLYACESDPPLPPPNAPPSLTLEAPGAAQQPRVGTPVELIARVEDAEEGTALEERVLWVSSLSGQLARGARTTGTFSQPGEQTLTATVTDSQGQAASASVTLRVLAENAPTVTVLSPAPGSSFNLGETLELSCEARAVSGTPLTGASIQWASALSGSLPSGSRVQVSLSEPGEDTLTCTATDPVTRLSTSASVRITVKPTQAPAVLITRPAQAEAYVKAGEPVPFSPTVLFRATAQDFNTPGGAGNLDGSIQWTLEPGGTALGSGPSVSYTFTTPGTYTVTASVRDSLGSQARDSVRVLLVTNLPPTCDITQPREDNTRLALNASSLLEARCEDPETGAEVSPTWSTSVSPTPLGTGATLSAVLSVAGPQTISACAVDPDDAALVGCASRSVRAVTRTAPTGCAIQVPAANALLPAGVSLPLQGSATDAEDPQADLRYMWTSNRDGPLALGASASGQLATPGAHNLTLTVTDPWGLACTASLAVRVNGAPQARINSVVQGSTNCLTTSCREGQPVTASGSATDAPEGVASLEWLDDLADGLGSSAQANLPAPIAGKHTLVLRATDTGGAVGRDAATMTVLPSGRTELADTLLDNGKSVFALAALPGEVRYLEGEASSVFRYPASASLPTSGMALALFPLTVAGGPVLFVGTEAGVERCTHGTCALFRGGPLSAASNRVRALAALASPDLLLVGTDEGLVLTRSSNPAAGGRPGTVVGRRILDGVKVRQVVISPASSATQVKAWAATTEGLAELTIPVEAPFEPALALATAVLHVPPALPEKDVLAVAVSPAGMVFAGTPQGFATPGRLGPALKAEPWSLQDEVAQVLLFERRGTGATAREVLWVGTRDGLLRYDISRDIVTRYGEEDGLPSKDIRSLALGADGTKYIGTASGLASYAGP